MIDFELRFTGGMADEGLLEFYDAAQALAGFQRSLALSTHLVLTGEIITQAPSARGFDILVPPFQEGSWKSTAKIVLAGTFAIGSVGKDSPVGHVVTSVYDYVLSETMGFHVDYDQTLQELYGRHFREKEISQGKLDSLCEKIENSVANMHRPIVASESANFAQISRCDYERVKVGPLMSEKTFEHVRQTIPNEEKEDISGYVTSYNVNTFKGRFFSLEENRPVPFEVHEGSRSRKLVGVLTNSQHEHGQTAFSHNALIALSCERLESVTGRVKRYIVLGASSVL